MAPPVILTGAPARDDFSPIQAAIVGRLNSDLFFADVSVIEEEAGSAETESDEALGLSGRLRKGGKVGACVIVMAPTREVDIPNVPGPVYAAEVILRCLEEKKINTSEGGTGKPATQIAQYVEQLFHLWRLGSTLIVARRGLPYADPQGAIGRDVTLTFELGLAPLPKCADPQFFFNAGLLSMSCPTPGATIRFTGDGAFPGVTADAYSNAVIPAAGLKTRAVAYAPGMAASNLVEWTAPDA